MHFNWTENGNSILVEQLLCQKVVVVDKTRLITPVDPSPSDLEENKHSDLDTGNVILGSSKRPR
jgi:hypothetical protein